MKVGENMNINKYKKLRNGKYELTLDNLETLCLYEDTILKYNLLLTKKVDSKKNEILEFDKKCDVYYTGVKYIKNRARSKKEVKDKLIKLEMPIDYIDEAIEKLERQGYINDLIYAKSFLNNKLITTANGPYKIKQEMLKKGVSNSIIEEVLEEYTEDIQIEKINKIVTRMIKSNRNKGNNLLKRKINLELLNQGFYKELINEAINNHEFNDDSDILKKEYEKLYRKLSNKYSGKELEYKIKQKLYQKGLIYEE